MRLKIFCTALLFIAFSVPNVMGADISQGDTVSIVASGKDAPLCPSPNCGPDEQLARIPDGTQMEIEGIMNVQKGMRDVMWFEVRYQGERGWISIYDTDKAR